MRKALASAVAALAVGAFSVAHAQGTPWVAAYSVPINTAAAATVQLVPAVAGKSIQVSSFDFIANGATTLQFEYGTGAYCGTGTVALTGPYPLAAQAGLAKGNGTGVVLFIPPGNALCAVNSAAVQVSGSVAYAQH